MASVLVVFSGSGGTGKSLFSANVSYGLVSSGNKVLLVEAAFGYRADDLILGIKSDSIYSFSDICSGHIKAREAVIKPEESCKPHFICSGFDCNSSNPGDGINAIVKSLSPDYDYIIFDLSSCFDSVFEEAIRVCDIAIAVTDDSPISVRNTGRATGRAFELGCKKIYTVLNNVVINGDDSSSVVEDIVDELGTPLIGIIPKDEHIRWSVEKSDPIYRYSTYAGRSIENICNRLMGINTSQYETGVSQGLFSKNKLVLK